MSDPKFVDKGLNKDKLQQDKTRQGGFGVDKAKDKIIPAGGKDQANRTNAPLPDRNKDKYK